MSRLLQALSLLQTFRPSWITLVLGTFGSIAASLILAYVYFWYYGPYFLTFKNLPGPPRAHWFWGNLKQILKAPTGEVHGAWLETYGPTFRYSLVFGSARFFTIDPTAISFILGHADDFPKPEQARRTMSQMLGNGVLVAEGDDHKKQRKVLNSSFSPAAIREMVPIFFDKAYELRDKLSTMIDDNGIDASATPAKEGIELGGGKKIDVMRYLGQCALDVIGLAGFDYDFASLSNDENELAEAFRSMFAAGQDLSFFAILQAVAPYFERFPTKRQSIISESREVTRRIGRKLIDDKKRAVATAHAEGLEKGHDIGKDLLSVVVRANMASDLKPEQKLTDEEVLAQITTFMLAGNETSSTALTWILWELAKHPECQDRLRKELMAVEDERLSMDALASLHYMDNVIREGLRVLAPVPNTIRKASKDCVLPLGTPVKGRDGKMMDSVPLKKGATLFIPILNMNTSTTIWGPDAAEFNPDRYDKPAAEGMSGNHVPGVWGNLMTFLGGQRNCIGYRFALVEMKAILFVLIRSFTFEEMPDHPSVIKKATIVMRPMIAGEESAGLQMPLLVKPLAG